MYHGESTRNRVALGPIGGSSNPNLSSQARLFKSWVKVTASEKQWKSFCSLVLKRQWANHSDRISTSHDVLWTSVLEVIIIISFRDWGRGLNQMIYMKARTPVTCWDKGQYWFSSFLYLPFPLHPVRNLVTEWSVLEDFQLASLSLVVYLPASNSPGAFPPDAGLDHLMDGTRTLLSCQWHVMRGSSWPLSKWWRQREDEREINEAPWAARNTTPGAGAGQVAGSPHLCGAWEMAFVTGWREQRPGCWSPGRTSRK